MSTSALSDLSWDIRDVLGAPRRALDPSSVLLGAVGFLVAIGILTACTYLAVFVDGRFPLRYVWDRLHLFPWLHDFAFSYGGSFVQSAGIAVAGGLAIYVLVGISKLSYRRLKGDYRFGAKDAWDFARRRAHAVITLVSLLMVGVLTVVLIGLLTGYTARLPWIGSTILSLAIFPGIVLSIGAIVLALLAAGALILGSAVVGTLDDDWLDTLIHVSAIMWAQWWRWVAYELTLCMVVVVAAGVALLLLTLGLTLTLNLAGAFVPYKTLGMVLVAARYVPGLGFVLFRAVPPHVVMPYSLTPGILVAGTVLACAFVVLAALVAGYGLSVWATGQTLVYAVLRRRHLGQNIFEREDVLDRRAVLAEQEAHGQPPESTLPPAEAEKGSSPSIQIETKREGSA